jgi:hypothetical protein
MTTPRERTLAVLQTRMFLRQLANDDELPVAVRLEAGRLLRHYPGSVHPSYLELLEQVRGRRDS